METQCNFGMDSAACKLMNWSMKCRNLIKIVHGWLHRSNKLRFESKVQLIKCFQSKAPDRNMMSLQASTSPAYTRDGHSLDMDTNLINVSLRLFFPFITVQCGL